VSVHVGIEVDDAPVRVGGRVEATVIVTADAPRDIRGISVKLKGASWVRPTEDARTFLTEERRLAEEQRIEQGFHRFRVRFAIPHDAPPSFDAEVLVAYTMEARVEIPWWFDAVAERPVTVLPRAPHERPPPSPSTAASAARGEGALFIELTLDDTAWAPGETITGAFSIGNVGAARLDGATVSLAGMPDSIGVAIPGDRSIFKSLVGLPEGGVVRFALPIPKHTPPSFKSRVGDVARAVVVRIDGVEGESWVPIVIDAFPPREGALDHGVLVGAERWRAAWRDEGARYGLALAEEDLALRGALAGGRIHAVVRPRGNAIAANLTWDNLGIGLRVQRRGLMLSGVDMEDTSPAFAARFVARGREDAQVRAALDAATCAELVQFDAVEINDHGGSLSRATPARSTQQLQSFLGALAGFADAFAGAPDRLPPPSWASAEMVAAWRKFAATTSGRFVAGPMKLRDAVVDGEHVDVEVVPEGGPPEATRLVLHLDPAVEESPISPADVIRAARAIAGDADPPPTLDVRPEEMRLTIGGGVGDPEALRPLVAAMARFAARLRGEETRGPYR
jgi:hypothetical protein